jgi:hypothetical protein
MTVLDRDTIYNLHHENRHQSSIMFIAINPHGPILSFNEHGHGSNLRMFTAIINYPLVNCHITNWKITMLLMGKSTISMAMASIAILT